MSRAAMEQAQDALYVARELTELYDTEHAAWVNEKCRDALAALRAALAEQPAPSGIDTLALYRTLCDLTAEANAADTVIGRPRMLYERLAALRDQVGALNSLSLAAPPAPSGWKLVPVEPTQEMLMSAAVTDTPPDDDGVHRLEPWLRAMWSAMLDAAPRKTR